jgi:hypothetical protein
MILHDALVRPKPEYASVPWNSITLTDSSELGRIQGQFAALYYSRFLIGIYDNTIYIYI